MASVAITLLDALPSVTEIGDGPTGAAITGGVITCSHKLNMSNTASLRWIGFLLVRDVGADITSSFQVWVLEIEYEAAVQLRGILGICRYG